jgi:hypothetical protein
VSVNPHWREQDVHGLEDGRYDMLQRRRCIMNKQTNGQCFKPILPICVQSCVMCHVSCAH